MTEQLLLGFVALSMFILANQTGDRRIVWITGLLALGFGSAMLVDLEILIDSTSAGKAMTIAVIASGMIGLLVGPGLVVWYAFKSVHLKMIDRLIIGFMGAYAFVHFAFIYQHWPFANEMNAFALFPLLGLPILIGNGLLRKKEFGFVLVLCLFFFLGFMNLVRFWMGLSV